MKKSLLSFAVVALAFGACNSGEKAEVSNDETSIITNADAESNAEGAENTGITNPSMFGAEITIEKVTSSEDLMSQLAETDTVKDIVISGIINSVCKKKGCWMKVNVGLEKDLFVKFLDYEFFMPKDSDGSTAVMQGNAYAETISVDDLKHYAEDDGKSEEEIAAITEPETKYSFMASGVILKDYVRKEKMDIPENSEADHDHSEEGHSH